MKRPTIKRYLTAIRRANYPMTCGDFAKMVRKAEERSKNECYEKVY